MKKKIYLLLFILSLLKINSCQDPGIRFDPKNEIEIDVDPDITIPDIVVPDIVVPDIIEPEESIDDPQQTGVACASFLGRNSIAELIEITEIPSDLPNNFDLSENMPPVRSQGQQGSCVAWATTYYLKSYQEKIQHGYDYTSYENVMSPAFVYNQSKSNDNCGSGSGIEDALDVLKNSGTNTWKEFPYSDAFCSALPSEELLTKAEANKIKEYYRVGIPETNTDPNYTLISLIKTLISKGNPIVIAMDFKNLVFETKDDKFIANTYSKTPIEACNHAILIVGYNDDTNAFKIVNSWGTSWGNEGYAWVNYNFFVTKDDASFQQGFGTAFIAYDED